MHIQIEGSLFEAVQTQRIFKDSKTFPDAKLKPVFPPEHVLQKFEEERDADDFDLLEFVARYFFLDESLENYIDRLWPRLIYSSKDENTQTSTLIPLPHPYVVPGGRFVELYYWDTYFASLGLVKSGYVSIFEQMIENFANLIDTYGYIPNGNRLYYLSRSQPPFFNCMLQLLEKEKGTSVTKKYIKHLNLEYEYWMKDRQLAYDRWRTEKSTSAERKVVILEDGAILNRYWDAENTPRQEGYIEDFIEGHKIPPDTHEELYRNLRSAAESGWDFNSRFLWPSLTMKSIRTIEFAPIDLNSVMYSIERYLAEHSNDDDKKKWFHQAATLRKSAVISHFWNDKSGWFFDLVWQEGKLSEIWSLAAVYPLAFQMLDLENEEEKSMIQRMVVHIETKFLMAGGVVTSLSEVEHCQWDFPNGWAPLQWMTVQGLVNYGYDDLAKTIAQRFVNLVRDVYKEQHKVLEKYNVCDLSRKGNDGEYIVQDGFGWTNGVVKAFMEFLRTGTL